MQTEGSGNKAEKQTLAGNERKGRIDEAQAETGRGEVSFEGPEFCPSRVNDVGFGLWAGTIPRAIQLDVHVFETRGKVRDTV